MALAIALFTECGGEKVIPVVVDHGLQPNSAQITTEVAAQLKGIGYKRVETATAQVIVTDGLEASARRARYKIFNQFIDSYQPKYFFLAHTLNDQAESVLLGLARVQVLDPYQGWELKIIFLQDHFLKLLDK